MNRQYLPIVLPALLFISRPGHADDSQWRMYEPGEAFLKGEYAFNLAEEVN